MPASLVKNPKGKSDFWGYFGHKERERDRESVCVCVCEREREVSYVCDLSYQPLFLE